MNRADMRPVLNSWDSDFFGIKSADINVPEHLRADAALFRTALRKALEEAGSGGYEYLVVTLKGRPDPAVENILTEEKFSLCDVSVDLRRKCPGRAPAFHPGRNIKMARADDAVLLRDIVTASFTRSRLYSIPGIRRERVHEYHMEWVRNLIEEEDSYVSVAFDPADAKSAEGFIAFSLDTDLKRARIVLIAVDPGARAKGKGSSLMDIFFDHCLRHGIEDLFVKTQKDNEGALRFYRRHGFSAFEEQYKYHLSLNYEN